MTSSDFEFNEFKAVDRHHGLSRQEFELEYLKPGKPVVLADLNAQWPAMSKWTPEYFRKNFGEKVVKVKDKPMPLREYLDLIEQASEETPAPYLYGFEMEDLAPELLEDISPASTYLRHDRLISRLNPIKLYLATELLIGGPGTRFHLHFDVYKTHGFVTQIYGRKEFTLFSPDNDECMYPSSERKNWSLIDNIDSPDLDRFPMFKNAEPYRVVVNPGETIFQPSGWWHTTRLLDPCIAIVRSSVDSGLWNTFVQEVYEDQIDIKPIRSRLRMAYLQLAGNFMVN